MYSTTARGPAGGLSTFPPSPIVPLGGRRPTAVVSPILPRHVFLSEGEGTRTLNHRIDSQIPHPQNPEENGDFPKAGAPGAAVESEIGISDPDLAVIVQRWDSLPEAVKAGIVAMVKATGTE